MHTFFRIASMALLVLVLSVASFAGFINGGFENGNLNGWTTTGTAGVVTNANDIRTNNSLQMVSYGTYSARIGDQVAWGYAGPITSSLMQTSVVAAGDDSDLYFNYAVVALVPTNGGHGLSETPYFQVNVTNSHNGTTTSLYSLNRYSGNPGTIQPGWLPGVNDPNSIYGQNSPGTWYYFPWTQVHINLADAGIQIGDELTVELIVRDCTQSGHAAYAYLDGFGSTPTPIPSVPEPSSFLLLSGGLGAVIYGVRRKKS